MGANDRTEEGPTAYKSSSMRHFGPVILPQLCFNVTHNNHCLQNAALVSVLVPLRTVQCDQPQ